MSRESKGTGSVDLGRLERMRQLLDRWTKETKDPVPSLAERTPADVDYVTGQKKTEFWRGQPPGASTHARQIIHPGPIRK